MASPRAGECLQSPSHLTFRGNGRGNSHRVESIDRLESVDDRQVCQIPSGQHLRAAAVVLESGARAGPKCPRSTGSAG